MLVPSSLPSFESRNRVAGSSSASSDATRCCDATSRSWTTEANDTRSTRREGTREAGTLRATEDLLTRWLATPGGTRRLVVAFCVAVTLVAAAFRYPDTFDYANQTARDNAALDYLDREIGGGNSVLPAQAVAIEARGRIPADGTFRVEVGERQEGWSELATPDALDTYLRYFLLPRRPSDDAPWIICFACDRSAHPGAEVVWEDEEGLSILKAAA